MLLAALSIMSGFLGPALQFAEATTPALAVSPPRAQAAWVSKVLFIPPRSVQASKDLPELTECSALSRGSDRG